MLSSAPTTDQYNWSALQEGVCRVRLLGALTSSYLLFWSPLFLVTVFSWGDTWDTGTESTPHQVTSRVIIIYCINISTLR